MKGKKESDICRFRQCNTNPFIHPETKEFPRLLVKPVLLVLLAISHFIFHQTYQRIRTKTRIKERIKSLITKASMTRKSSKARAKQKVITIITIMEAAARTKRVTTKTKIVHHHQGIRMILRWTQGYKNSSNSFVM
jgi:hypothetical protein